MKREGRPEKIRSEGLCVLRELALKPPPATLDELVKAFQIRSGLQVVHSAPLRKPLASLGGSPRQAIETSIDNNG